MDAFILLVDSTDRPSFPDGAALVSVFTGYHAVPYLVAANKIDLEGAASLEEVRRGMGLSSDITVMPCQATSKDSVHQVLSQVIELIEARK